MTLSFNSVAPIVLVASSAALYHVGSKSLGGMTGLNPWVVLTITYFLSFVGTGSIALFVRGGTASNYTAAVPYAFLLAAACVGIEAGYLIAYRGGINVTTAVSVISTASTLAIMSVGLLFFREALPPAGLVGLLFVAAGIGLMHWR